MIAIYTSYFNDIIAYFVSSNFLFTIPQKLSKRTVSWPLSHRMTTFTTSTVSPRPTWILKPSAIFPHPCLDPLTNVVVRHETILLYR